MSTVNPNPSVTVDLKVNDQISEKLREIQGEFGTLLEVKVDRWPMASVAWSIVTFLIVLVDILGRMRS